MAHSDNIAVSADHSDGIGNRLTLGNRGRARLIKAENLATEAHHSRCEGKACSGGGLKEERTENLALTAVGIHLGIIDYVGGETNKAVNFLGRQIENVDKISHINSPCVRINYSVAPQTAR